MPKHTTEFKLPDEYVELQIHLQAEDMYSLLWDFLHTYLRDKIKFEDMSDKEVAVYEDVRTYFVNSLLERGITLD